MPSILLVEDDEALARNLTQFLTAEGFSVKHGSGQRAGMQLFLSDSFDCVLLDLTLGDGNGFSLCKAIREFSQVPVIFLTASAEESCTSVSFVLWKIAPFSSYSSRSSLAFTRLPL